MRMNECPKKEMIWNWYHLNDSVATFVRRKAKKEQRRFAYLLCCCYCEMWVEKNMKLTYQQEQWAFCTASIRDTICWQYSKMMLDQQCCNIEQNNRPSTFFFCKYVPIEKQTLTFQSSSIVNSLLCKRIFSGVHSPLAQLYRGVLPNVSHCLVWVQSHRDHN